MIHVSSIRAQGRAWRKVSACKPKWVGGCGGRGARNLNVNEMETGTALEMERESRTVARHDNSMGGAGNGSGMENGAGADRG